MNRTCRMIAKNVVGLALGMACLAGAGCFQIETLVDFHEDGSATITERLNFSRPLLDMAAADPERALEPLLQKEAALQRMKAMGSGVEMVSHKIQNGERGSLESVVVFRTRDLNGFRYVSPWLAYGDYADNNAIEWKVVPMYKSRPYGGRGTGAAGSLAVRLDYVAQRPKGKGGEETDSAISPADAQVFRELGPVFRDMLEDFQLNLTFRAYAPVFFGANLREQRALSRSVELISVTDRDLDRHGFSFFENEEIMLNFVQWQLDAREPARHLQDYGSNLTLPVVTPFGSRHMWPIGVGVDGHAIYLPPSRPLFDRHFQGKKLDFAQWAASEPDKHVPATWERIGFVPVGDGR